MTAFRGFRRGKAQPSISLIDEGYCRDRLTETRKLPLDRVFSQFLNDSGREHELVVAQVSNQKPSLPHAIALADSLAKSLGLGRPVLGIAQSSNGVFTLYFVLPYSGAKMATPLAELAQGLELGQALSLFVESDGAEIHRAILNGFGAAVPVSVSTRLCNGDAVLLTCSPDPSDRNRLLLSLTQRPDTSLEALPFAAPPAHARLTLDKLMSALETLEVGIAVYDQRDRLLYGNERYFKYVPPSSRESHIGRSFEEICAMCADAEVYGPRPQADSIIADRLSAHRLGNQAFELALPDKRIERIIERKTHWGGSIGMHFDVSDLYHARENALLALQDSEIAEKRLSAAIEAMPDGFVLWDEDERLAVCNSRYRQIYSKITDVIKVGVPFPELFHASVMAGYHSDLTADVDFWMTSYLETWRRDDLERTIKTPEGRYIRILNSHHQGLGTLGIHTDVTDIMVARLEAIQSEKAKSMFLANMSHEIRTPLAGIISLAQLILDISTEEDVRDRCGTIVKFGSSLMTILNDILDMSKLEVGKLELLSEPICIKTFADRFCVLYAASAQEKGLRFDVDINPAIHGRLGDENRILQILNNVISNAIKFTQSGSVKVSMQDGTSGDLIIRVEDTGIGMTPEQISRIFNPFEQAEKTTALRFGGTGLGMSIVANLVKAMGGKIELASTVGKGTTITISLPLPITHDEAQNKGDFQPPDPVKGARLLVAEDNDIIREMVSIFLSRMGCDVQVVDSGNAAFDLFAAAIPFDLVLLDINMPDGDGASTLARMREFSKETGLPLPPIVAITANMLKHQVDAYIEMGFTDCLPKPFFKADLQRCISRHARKQDRLG